MTMKRLNAFGVETTNCYKENKEIHILPSVLVVNDSDTSKVIEFSFLFMKIGVVVYCND
jgi:hypothetical protein